MSQCCRLPRQHTAVKMSLAQVRAESCRAVSHHLEAALVPTENSQSITSSSQSTAPQATGRFFSD